METKTRDGKPVLQACTKESIAFALQKMVVLGLSPIKKQCDFIAYGDQLQCSPEYTANEMLAKRYGMKDIFKVVVYKDDEFEDGIDAKTGKTIVVRHKPCGLMQRTKENIIGAYAVVTMEDGTTWAEIMNMEMIRDSWNQGATKGQSPAHKNFPGEMARKTVSNRATKSIIRSSDDAALFRDDIADEGVTTTEQKVQDTVAKHANKVELSIEDAEEVPVTTTEQKTEPGFTPEELAEIEAEEKKAAMAENDKSGADLFGGKGRVVKQPGF
jgi:recombination protein RecT